MAKQKKLYRTTGKKRKIAGVCGGIAEYLDVDPTVIRLIWVIATLAYGVGLLAYLLAWLIMPEK
ncbi:PspC domain-containing protein [Candidatus Pacearchaeota archaeon]|jgi:phage shock protein C|nr:PspC domain-containing protein [Candidatus Pacearchaeota archaeon]|tara:strand:+ start:12301 stop:12492 length:192 start_codon:yes stop_codon:yes gene_type:complete